MNFDLLVPLFNVLLAFWSALTDPLRDFITEHVQGLQWLVDLLEGSNLGEVFLSQSLGAMILGAGLLIVITIQIIYFFIP